jgi:serine protease inhibitor
MNFSRRFEKPFKKLPSYFPPKISKDVPDNVVVSPFSIQTAVSMLIGGAPANSTTRQELIQLFGDIDDFHAFEKFLAKVLADYKVRSQ